MVSRRKIRGIGGKPRCRRHRDGLRIRSLEVVVMEVPCCGGLVRLVETATRAAVCQVPLTVTTVGIDGRLRSRRAA